MRIRLTTDRVDRGVFQQEGEVIDLPDAEARRLVDARQAEAVSQTAPKPRDQIRRR